MVTITPLPEHAVVPDLTEWIEILHVGEIYSIHNSDKRQKPCYGVAAFLRKAHSPTDSIEVEKDIRTLSGSAVRGSWFPTCGTCGGQYSLEDVSNAIRVLWLLEEKSLFPPTDKYLEVWKAYEKHRNNRL